MTTTTVHEHTVSSYRMDMALSGVDHRGGYVYGYRVTCACGATGRRQYRDAASAKEATDAWDAAGAEED